MTMSMRNTLTMVGLGLILGMGAACGGGAFNEPNEPNDKEENEEEPPRASVLAVEVAPGTLALRVGERATLIGTVRGEGDFDASLEWASSDPAVAKVDDGEVRALGAGEVTITATSVAEPTKQGEATVTVAAASGTGELLVTTEGLPEDMEADPMVCGAERCVGRAQPGHAMRLQAGVYTVYAPQLRDGHHSYLPPTFGQEVEVRPSEATELAIRYEVGLPLFEIEAGSAILPLHAHADVVVDLTRHGDFDGPVTIRVEGLPEGISSEEVRIEAGENQAVLRLESDGTRHRLGQIPTAVVARADQESSYAPANIEYGAIVTSFEDSGPGTLRHYLALAPRLRVSNIMRSDPPVMSIPIRFDPALDEPVSILLESPLVINSTNDADEHRRAIAIHGPKRDGGPLVTLEGQGRGQLMVVETAVSVSDLVLRGGSATRGGAISNLSGLSIIRSHLEGNVATEGGGAIENLGSLTLTEVSFAGNEAEAGGAILNHGQIEAEDSRFVENSARVGGGIYSEGSFSISASSFEGNRASADGGGLYVLTSEDEGTYGRMLNSTLAANLAEGRGGGLFVEGDGASTLRHCTLSGNEADEGGGLFNQTELGIVATLVAGNRSGSGGDLHNASSVVSGGYNLFGASSGGAFPLAETDIVGEDPLLGELADHGGNTPTIDLLPGSPAVDAIPRMDCTIDSGGPLVHDQRGSSRPAGEGCDIGAYELQ